MKKSFNFKLIIVTVSASILFGTFLFFKLNTNKNLIYDEENSTHATFFVDDRYVTVIDSIVVKNPTKKDLYFHMYADMSEDYGLVKDKIVPACKENTLEKQVFYIKAKSTETYCANFKGKKGNKKTKFDRLPPENIVFELLK